MLYCVASAIAQRAGKLAWRREGIPFISGPSGIEGDDYQRNPEAELHTVFLCVYCNSSARFDGAHYGNHSQFETEEKISAVVFT